jgi:hypothetical protein
MKSKIISFLIVAVIAAGLVLFSFNNKSYSKANEVYQVYLNGNKIGTITDKDDLYNLINERQQEIKEKYGVDKVYPPNGFDIVKSYTYNDIVNDVDEIYQQIENADDFTIKGYTITIHPTEPDEDGKTKHDVKTIAKCEVMCNLEDLLKVSSKLLSKGGRLYIVHKPERLSDLIAIGRKYNLEAKEIKFVYPKLNMKPSIVLISYIKDGGNETKVLEPLIEYNGDGSYTKEFLDIYKN